MPGKAEIPRPEVWTPYSDLATHNLILQLQDPEKSIYDNDDLYDTIKDNVAFEPEPHSSSKNYDVKPGKEEEGKIHI